MIVSSKCDLNDFRGVQTRMRSFLRDIAQSKDKAGWVATNYLVLVTNRGSGCFQ